MSKYRKIDTRIWNDGKFSKLSERGKLVFLFVLTHPHMTSLGAMRHTVPGMAAEFDIDPKAFGEAFGEGVSKGIVEVDPQASFVGVPNFLKYNKPESPNVVKAWEGAFDLIPECELKRQLVHRLRTYVQGYGEAFAKAFGEALSKAMPNQEQEPEQEPDNPHTPSTEGDKSTEESTKPMGFEQFWSAWPQHRRKVARSKCERIWKRQKCDVIAEQVIAAVGRCKVSEDWTKENGKFIPAPMTWLNQERWEAPEDRKPMLQDEGEDPKFSEDDMNEFLGGDNDA